MRRAQELQMQINDVMACHGACAGCVLSASERRAVAPSMTSDVLEAAISRLEEHARSLAPLQKVNVIYGIGDHILHGADYIVRLHELGTRVVLAGEPIERSRSVVFFTTSLVGRQDDVIALMREVHSRIDDTVPLIPQVVLDGRLINAEKFGPRWKTMVTEAKRLFGRVDLATNLSGDAIRKMPPEELMEFARANGFDGIALNWAPTLGNAVHTYDDVDAIADWLLRFDELVLEAGEFETTYRPVIEKMLRLTRNEPTMSDLVREIVTETMTKAFEIEPDGTVIPKFEAVGDVTHSARHGLPGIGRIQDAAIADLIAASAPKVMARIISTHAQGACAQCPYSAACAGTGFHVATHVGRRTRHIDDARPCPHVAASLFSRIDAHFSTLDNAA